jgi:Predicted hydrolases or acyltransferases (alpha/beta hydrolase superfamily)
MTAAVTWETGYVEAEGGLRLHYTRAAGGAGKPPLVLAHGFSDDGPCWTLLAEVLAPNYDVVMPDARGHGKSDAPEEGASGLMERVEDLRAVILALGQERPVILGHSMGGATALALAGAYPDLPGAIVVEDATAFGLNPTPPATPPANRPPRPHWVTTLKRKTHAELVADQRAATPHWAERELILWAESKQRMSPLLVSRPAAEAPDWRALLPRIACPALLLTADPARGALVSPEGAEQLRSLVPHLRVVHIPDAGHCIRRDQPDRYLTEIRSFLAEVARS